MEIMLFFWLILCFVVSFAGVGKSVGYWGTFFISLILSPLIGLIIALISSSNRGFVPQTSLTFTEARKAEHRGDYEVAIKLYKDTIFDIVNAPKTKDRILRNHRLNQKLMAEKRISDLLNKL